MNYSSRLLLRAGAIAGAVAVLALSAGAASAQTLAAIKQRGMLACGVSEGIYGFSIETPTGWAGFDVDLCRALAAAVLNDPAKVRYVPLNAAARFPALQSGAIDVLVSQSVVRTAPVPTPTPASEEAGV